MERFACLVMPVDLAERAVGGPADRGSLYAAKGDRERVFVALAAEPENGLIDWSEALSRLSMHRFVRPGGNETLRWVVVRPGFRQALREDAINTLVSLAAWGRAPIPSEFLIGAQPFLCCLEPGIASPLVSFVLIVAGDDDSRDVIMNLDVELVEDKPQPYRRIDGLVPLEQLRTKRVAVVGLGSGGSVVALELAAAGVGRLHFFDSDRLRAANLFRHVCGRSDLGRLKVHAVADLIRDHDLPAEIVAHGNDVLATPDRLRTVADEVDLVIGATDTVASRRLVNYVCVKAGVPLVLAAAFDAARIGEIIRMLPGRTACYECVRLQLRASGSLVPAMEEEQDRRPYSPQRDQETPTTSQGMRTDVVMLAALQARVAVMTLLGDDPAGIGLVPRSYITWGATRNQAFAAPFAFPYPFTANFVDLPRRPDCPVCGQPPAELLGVDIDQAYAQIVAILTATQAT